MKKKLLVLLVLLSFLLPINTLALSKDYKDEVYDIVDKKVESGKVNLYLFRGEGCPHCRDEEKWLKSISKEYGDKLNIYTYEVWYDKDNSLLMEEVAKRFDTQANGVPFTIIGDKYYFGFSETIQSNIENTICDYLEIENKSEVKIPFLGKVNMRNVSIPMVAAILGLIDGFNPCAMWILLFLINMLFGMKDTKKSLILGFIFLFVSGFVYFLSMLGINFIISVATVSILKIAIALFILGAGIYNFNKYLKIRKEETGCVVVDDKKRKKIITKIRNIVSSKSFIISIVGIMALAISVNLIELACSLGFPMVFNELLTINNVKGVVKFIYLLIYIICYMLDDIVVFTISMCTLEAFGITNKYSKLTTLISAIIMIIMGLLLIFKPDWLMLNF
ncbi:MAG: thioredoxin family protein [Firmicutes bacterium]|nr:thioredoxin family protein [Bacillota bacterium]